MALKYWNARVVEEFRANAGQVGGMFKDMPLLLLHTVGRRTGARYVVPLTYQEIDEGFAIFASNGGSKSAPQWLGNLLSRPHTSVEVGDEQIPVKASIASGGRKAFIWARQVAAFPQFARYQQMADRDIAVVVLTVHG